MLNVHDAPPKKHSTSEIHIVELVDYCLVQGLPAEDRVEAKVELNYYVEEVLVEVVADDEGDAAVGLSPVEEQERLQKLELSNGIVTRPCSLHSFLTSDTNSDMSFKNHCYIICSVSDCQSHLFWKSILYHLD